ncbi:MAG TPA: vanadium-dependent haloperoxidase [Polyangiaceae bacterium]|nr:vanadium-dependent haloperoxidase [Polyangiaceae bacterium]
MRTLGILGLVGASLFLADAAKADVVTDWNEVAIGVNRRLALGTNKATRSLAITHLAIFDTVESVTRKYRPYAGYVTSPGPVSLEAAVATAAHDALLWLNPTDAAEIDYQLERSLGEIDDGDTKDNGIALGRRVAADIVFSRIADGSSDTETYDLTIPPDPDVNVNPVPGSGLWRPTPRAPSGGTEAAGLAALDPQWRSVATFGILTQNQFHAVAPPALTAAAYTAAYNEVKVLGAFNAPVTNPPTNPPTGRSSEQTDTANFWRVNTEIPFNAIARTVASRGNRSIEENARLFALLNVALADARIAIWESKYSYGYWRPVTAIRLGERDGNPDTVGDPTWRPLLETPAHPSYVSGHSGTGSAAAAVLAKVFGDSTQFAVSSDTLVGAVRSFTTFSAAASQNAESRLFGGIHWRSDNDRGLELGYALGNYVADHLFALNPPDPGGEGGAGGEPGSGGEDGGGEGGLAGAAGEATGGSATGGRGGTSTGGTSGTAGQAGEGATTTGGSSGSGGGGSGGTSSGPKPVEDDSGCDCRTTGKSGDGRALALAGLGLFLALRRRVTRR